MKVSEWGRRNGIKHMVAGPEEMDYAMYQEQKKRRVQMRVGGRLGDGNMGK